MSSVIKILSIDGGGIRGVIPAMVLAEIERLTGKPVAELFHLIAGTSTGGILALGLAKPDDQRKPQFSARQMVSLYEQEGSRIFSASLWQKIRRLGNLLDEKYPADGIEDVLHEYFGEARFKDVVTDVVVTAYETERRFPFFFKSRNAKTKDGYDVEMRLVARATSAAPTYFEPLKLDVSDPAEYYSLIDGGVYANNPAMCGYVEARTMFPEATEFLVVSLGTGELTRPLRYQDVKGWGLAQWAQPILNVVFDGVSSTVDYQLRQLLPPNASGVMRYYRFQVRLDPSTDDLDDASRDNMRSLKLLAESLIRDRTDDLHDLCAQLNMES